MTDHHDPELQAALDRSQTRASSGISQATLGLGAAIMLVVGFLGGWIVTGRGDDAAAASGGTGRPGASGYGMPGGAPGGQGAAGGGTAGTVTSVHGDTLTLETADGSTVTVTAGDDTTVTVTQDGTLSDLAEGDSVVVSGETDGDQVTADSITEGGFGGRGMPGAAG